MRCDAQPVVKVESITRQSKTQQTNRKKKEKEKTKTGQSSAIDSVVVAAVFFAVS